MHRFLESFDKDSMKKERTGVLARIFYRAVCFVDFVLSVVLSGIEADNNLLSDKLKFICI